MPSFWVFGDRGRAELLSAGPGPLLPLESRQTSTEQLGNNRRQTVIRDSEWWQGQDSRRQEMVACCPWCLTLIGVDSLSLRAGEAGWVHSGLSSQWLSALLPLCTASRGEAGPFCRYRALGQTVWGEAPQWFSLGTLL